MREVKRQFFALVILLTISLVYSQSVQAQSANVNGKWKMLVKTSQGNGSPVFVLKHENDSIISGTYEGRFGKSDVKGTLKEDKISLKFSSQDMKMEYKGTVNGNDMKGSVIFGSYGNATFTGKREEN